MIPWLGMENDIFVEKSRGTQKQKRLGALCKWRQSLVSGHSDDLSGNSLCIDKAKKCLLVYVQDETEMIFMYRIDSCKYLA
jgi:hypothetical protein